MNNLLNIKTPKERKKRDKINPNTEENNSKEAKEEEKSQKIQLPELKIYDLERNQENILVVDNNNNSFKKDQERITTEAKEITKYYLELHKNMINTYNLVYSQIIQNNSDLSWDVFFTNTEQFLNYQLEMKNRYTRLISNRDESLKLIDNIITKNLDTFIKSLELIQKFL